VPTRRTDGSKGQHILNAVGWIEGALTKVTEGEFRIDDRAVAPSDCVNFFVTGGDLLETVQYLWSEFSWVGLEDRSAIGERSLDLHREILERSVGQHVLRGCLTNSETFVWAPVNCRAERLLEVFVHAEIEVNNCFH
jgi:hypothetical protein